MAKYNDMDMTKWKEYSDIWTDSLWLIDKRDNSGVHTGTYHGNFVPQIPNQLFRRYTKAGDWVLDPFVGSGTSLIEAQRLNRNYLGIEIQESVAEETNQRLLQEHNDNTQGCICVGDSSEYDLSATMKGYGIEKVQFVMFHPPYWDIIRFSDNPADISNAKSLEEFLNCFGKVIDNTCRFLETDRYCGLVIGDKYANGELVPLGFLCMELFLKRGFRLKAVIVKNYDETKGKAKQQGIWRYRALANDFYVFKHEYIMIFKKVKDEVIENANILQAA